MTSSTYRSLASRINTAVPAKRNSTSSSSSSSPIDLNVNVIKGKNQQNHVLFLHGLFGKGQSFQFLAKAKAIQENYTCHMVDMRNHGESAWDATMDYESLARDIHNYIVRTGLDATD